MKTPLEALHEQFPPNAGEPAAAYRLRLVKENKARFYTRADVRAPQAYKAAEAECASLGAEMVILPNEEPSFATRGGESGKTPVTIKRSEAKDMRKYMAAKEQAAKQGVDLQVVDD
ncbi:MAG TPA: hypothetical protein VFW04_04510 [Gemmatimonadaceae bacterium]|nr:hypothetical protein [Gemmatimonadaceae bacterium]